MKRPAHPDFPTAVAALGDAGAKLQRAYGWFAPLVLGAMTGPEPDVRVVSPNADTEAPAEQIPAEEAGMNPRHAVIELNLRLMLPYIEELLIAFDDCYAHIGMPSDFSEWRTNLTKVSLCDWCMHLGKRVRSTGGWSEGDDAVHLCQPHHFQFMSAIGNDPKLFAHEPIHSWQRAGYPEPGAFFKQWTSAH